VWHGRGKGTVTEGPLSIYDIAPSILDYFNIPAPAEMIGKVL
jgi:bisphosphoglycerate-independent phosphoglycerate mutase (AlkP superfamily)